MQTPLVQIKPLSEAQFPAWDDYVDTHPKGSFFHLTGWYLVITGVFGHKPHYLVAMKNDQIVGVLPLFEQKSPLFGHALISTPFCVYGGALADDRDIEVALEDHAYQLGCELGVDYVELRDKEQKSLNPPWIRHCQHSVFSSPIANTENDILTSIKRKQRAVIRHSMKNALHWSDQTNLDSCYDLYAQSVHQHGTPVFDKRLFTELKNVFGERCETLIVEDKQGIPVSSVMSFYYKDTVLPYYGGSSATARDLKSHDFMYYTLMCNAKQKGIDQFDFGRSKQQSGAYSYKKNWGMQEQPLHYRIALINAKTPPNLSPNNPKYQLLIKLWKKMPLSWSRAIGPQLSKYLG